MLWDVLDHAIDHLPILPINALLSRGSISSSNTHILVIIARNRRLCLRAMPLRRVAVIANRRRLSRSLRVESVPCHTLEDRLRLRRARCKVRTWKRGFSPSILRMQTIRVACPAHHVPASTVTDPYMRVHPPQSHDHLARDFEFLCQATAL